MSTVSSKTKRSLSVSKSTDVTTDENKQNETSLEPPLKRRKTKNNKHFDSDSDYDVKDDIDNNSISNNENENNINYSLYKLKELKELCRNSGLKVGGNKSQLINRLKNPNDINNKRKSSSNKKSNGSGRMTLATVNKKLKQLLDIENPERAGIGRGYIKLCGNNGSTDKDSILNRVVYSGNCICCGKSLDCTISDLLDQPDYAGLDYEDGGENGAAQCEDCCGNYLTNMCSGKFSYDSGKFHNHCTECKGFGKCIGDYREAHCNNCGKHYFQGLTGFACQCQESGNNDMFGFGFW